jgi:predicted phosphate transport protein (TIGR00153 family)
MVLKQFFVGARREQAVIGGIKKHIELLCSACETFKLALKAGDRNRMRLVPEMEREGDIIRRGIISLIYEGAFLPYLRPNLCRFVEVVDDVFDCLQETAQHSLNITVPEQLLGECVRVAHLNHRMCEMLLFTFETTMEGKDLREKALAVRIYEKKIDDIKIGILKDARKIPVASFWEGESLSNFLSGLTNISNIIEDATDSLQIINVSMR